MEQGQTKVNREPTIREACNKYREEIGVLARKVKWFMTSSGFKNETQQGEDRAEMQANIMLCYRHLEDARMRIGKVLQAQDGGKSVYDRKDVRAALDYFNGAGTFPNPLEKVCTWTKCKSSKGYVTGCDKEYYLTFPEVCTCGGKVTVSQIREN